LTVGPAREKHHTLLNAEMSEQTNFATFYAGGHISRTK
jgi:hypothetical protein